MTRFCSKLFAYFLIYLTPFLCVAQSATVSPYSRYGIGDMQNATGARSFAMGHTGIALRNDSTSPYFINLKNPASCFYNRITTIEAGVLNSNVTLSSQGVSHTAHNTYFGYFAIAFPIPRSKWGGACLGISPMSSLGYNITSTSPIDSIAPNGQSYPIDNATTQYTGEGGVNNAFLDLAIAPFKKRKLALGIDASYLFGNLTNVQTLVYPSNYNNFSVERAQNANIKSFYFKYGLMYTIGNDSGWHITLGLIGSPAYNIKARYNLLAINLYNGVIYDTIQDSNLKNSIHLPLMFGGGITVKKGTQWTFSADYMLQNWSQYTYFGQSESLNNSYQANLGIEYVPKKNPPHTTYFQRVYYRAGFSFNKTYLDINNIALNDYSVTLGFGFPLALDVVQHRISVVNIGLEAGQMGAKSDNLLEERYFKILFSFTFNDRWFQKREFQ